jgi:subtilisin family serine protease
MDTGIKVGLLDDGIAGAPAQNVVAMREFIQPARVPLADGHGSAMAAIITGLCGQVRLYDARVFPERGPATPASLAEALDWLSTQKVELVNISLGLRDDRDVLRLACARSIERGTLLVAAAPARGAAVYPAAYPGVLRVTGDARCAPGEYTWLDSPQATVGACVGGSNHVPGQAGGGASCAVAQVTGELARMRSAGVVTDDLLGELRGRCTYFGPEQRAR